MFDALIDPLQIAIVLLVIVIVMAAARWGNALAPGEAIAAQTEETNDRSTTGRE